MHGTYFLQDLSHLQVLKLWLTKITYICSYLNPVGDPSKTTLKELLHPITKERKDRHRQPRTLFTFVTYLLGRFWTDFNEIWCKGPCWVRERLRANRIWKFWSVAMVLGQTQAALDVFGRTQAASDVLGPTQAASDIYLMEKSSFENPFSKGAPTLTIQTILWTCIKLRHTFTKKAVSLPIMVRFEKFKIWHTQDSNADFWDLTVMSRVTSCARWHHARMNVMHAQCHVATRVVAWCHGSDVTNVICDCLMSCISWRHCALGDNTNMVCRGVGLRKTSVWKIHRLSTYWKATWIYLYLFDETHSEHTFTEVIKGQSKVLRFFYESADLPHLRGGH